MKKEIFNIHFDSNYENYLHYEFIKIYNLTR